MGSYGSRVWADSKLARRLCEAEVRASCHRVEVIAMRAVVDALIAIEVETLASFQDNFAMSIGMLPFAKRDEIEKAIRQRLREEGFDV